MREPWSTVNDPIFYLHHTNLDRIWSIWRKSRRTSGHSSYGIHVLTLFTEDLKPQNFWAMDGPRTPDGLGIQTTGPTSLDDILDLPSFIAPSVPIKSVMDTKNKNGEGILCYKYEKETKALPN